MVKLFVPFVAGRLNPATCSVVLQSGLPYRLENIDPGDDGAYGRMFRLLWAQKKTFLICEQDVVPTCAQLWQIASCDHDWCSFNYGDGLYPDGPMFGLVRFGWRVMARHPAAAEAALTSFDHPTRWGRLCDDTLEREKAGSPWTEAGERRWWAVDNAVARDLQIRGVPWTAHDSRVEHAHTGPASGPQ